jgi:hypothetical protein
MVSKPAPGNTLGATMSSSEKPWLPTKKTLGMIEILIKMVMSLMVKAMVKVLNLIQLLFFLLPK